MMAHSPDYLRQYCRLGAAIRFRGELDPVLRELAITRTGILCEAPYEVVAHKRIGKSVGVTDEQNAALEDWKPASCFDEVQRAALAFTDEIVTLQKPTDATLDDIAAKLTPGALIELQLSVGFYIMTSKFLETFGVECSRRATSTKVSSPRRRDPYPPDGDAEGASHSWTQPPNNNRRRLWVPAFAGTTMVRHSAVSKFTLALATIRRSASNCARLRMMRSPMRGWVSENAGSRRAALRAR